MFGYVEGAFSGAAKHRLGRFGAAAGGTIFFDEIGDLPTDLQAKLLRVLEERTYSPLGTEKEVPLEARVVSATNQQLDEAISRQKFRADLYFRLAQVNILLPSLQERKEDIPLLIQYFLDELPLRDELSLREEEILAISEHEWPGNIRELRSALERYALLRSAGHRPSLNEWLPGSFARRQTSRTGSLADLREEFDRRVLKDILDRLDGDTSRAAKELGITRRSIYNLIHRHGIQLEKRK
jgi:transcriptional regulator with PAS, ATPase and Fis domain